ncbi:MAG: winged helix-turn-helix domain-containing protein [Gallionella sp.]|nr:winged helix-turn-helix domain-containing protein [Gallionella sp.]
MTALRKNVGHPVEQPMPANISIGELHWSDDTARVSASGVPVLLRPVEFRLLGQLMNHAERVHTRAELLRKLAAPCIGERAIDVHIRRLRISLQPFGMDRWIQTVHTRGYRFSPSLTHF